MDMAREAREADADDEGKSLAEAGPVEAAAAAAAEAEETEEKADGGAGEELRR